MGIFNLIKLINDYDKAKKLLAEKDIKGKESKVRKTLADLQEFIVELESMKDRLADYIAKVRGVIRTLTTRLKKGEK